MTQNSAEMPQPMGLENPALHEAFQFAVREQDLLTSVQEDGNEYTVVHFIDGTSQLVLVKKGGGYGSGSAPMPLPDNRI